MRVFLMSAALLSGAAITLPAEANAECRAEIVKILKRHKTQTGAYAAVTTKMNGQIVSRGKSWIENWTRVKNEMVGHNVWSMAYDKYFYESKDGKTWQRSKFQSENWREEAKKTAERLYTTMDELKCGGTETLAGEKLGVVSYHFTTEKPRKFDTTTELTFEKDTLFVVRKVDRIGGPYPTEITTLYTPQPGLVIAPPAGVTPEVSAPSAAKSAAKKTGVQW